MVPDDRMYTQEHEWVLIEEDADGKVGTVGVTEFAAAELGDVVFVELPDTGSEFNLGDSVGTIESVKAVADLYLPLAGEILEINQAVVDHPELVNNAPLEEGWLLKLRIGNEDELESLLPASAYQNLLEG